MASAWWAGVVAGYGVAVPVGAVGVLIVSLSARRSPQVGVGAALGAATADAVYAAVAVVGGSALARLVAPVAGPARWVAAAVLVLLAAHTAAAALRDFRGRAGPARRGVAAGTPARAYLGVLALTMLNPATVVYFAALVLGQGAGVAAGPAAGAAFVAGAAVASASWQLLLAGGGALAGRLLAGPRGRLVTGLVSAVVVAGLALSLLW